MNASTPRTAVALKVRVSQFLCGQSGAVTVDWVVLTAAVVLLGVAAGFLVTSAVPELASKIDTTLRSMTVLPD